MGWSSCRFGRVEGRVSFGLHLLLATVLLIQTGVLAEGRIRVRLMNATANSLRVSWSFASPVGFNISSFTVSASPITSYLPRPIPIEGTAGDQQREHTLLGLSPATKYNITVWGISYEGNTTKASSLEAWTRIGELSPPERPTVQEKLKNGKRVLIVSINKPTDFHGPISKYLIVPIEQGSLMPFDPEKVLPFEDADRAGLPFYLAGSVDPQSSLQFIVGDNSSGNPFLEENIKYNVIVGVVSELNGEIKRVYSVSSGNFTQKSSQEDSGFDDSELSNGLGTSQGAIEREEDREVRRRDAVLVFILSVAIGVLGFLLVASFILYFILRRQYSSKRRSDELILKIHDHDNENGFFNENGKLHLEEGADLNGFYNRLCDLYWQIPRPQLHISDVVLGQGTFGPVRVGKVLRNGQEIPVQIQRCGAHFGLSDRDRRVLLAELEAMVRIGAHPNVVEFIGGCEEGDALWMATEHPNNPLRGVLLSSREQTEGRVSKIPEYRLMEMAISIADGMKHLAHRGVCHGCLSTRSIMIHFPDMVPKISNFSISRYSPLGKRLDFTRWTAPEAMRRRVTEKSDIWSYGVLLWEIFTLGGTPYVDLKSTEVQGKIARGHRLPQPRGVDTGLFQQMLHCWEMDPEERPSFEDITRDLRNVASEDPLRLPQQTKYIYDKFDPLADEC